MSFKSGPYVIAAALCQDCKEAANGSLSLVSLANGLTFTLSGTEPPAVMPPVTASLKLVLLLAPGRLRGRHQIKCIPELPSGETMPSLVFSANFGTNAWAPPLKVDFDFTFQSEGLYWFVLHFDGATLTKIPFSVRYVADRTAGPPIASN